VPLSFDHPAEDYTNGPGLVFELLEQVRRASPATKFVNLSSAAVYGQPALLPIDEDQVPAPLSPYGRHKIVSERISRDFAELFGLRTVSVRIFSAYGPGLRRQVLWDICRKIDQGHEVALQGTGAETRDFIHAADVARGLQIVAERAPLTGEVYNLATGNATSVAEVAAQIRKLLRPDCPVRYDGVLPRGTPKHWRADIGKLTALGFRPCVLFADGLADYVDWYAKEGALECVNGTSASSSREARPGSVASSIR
jgi:UDP-glucose 4-epimerase